MNRDGISHAYSRLWLLSAEGDGLPSRFLTA
jgi:hypothetical protein